MNQLKLGIGITLIAYLFFASASALVSGVGSRFSTIQVIFIQNFVSLLCILPLALRKGWKRLQTDRLSLHLTRDLFGVTSYFLFFLAIRHLDLVNATTLTYTAPFFVPFVARLWHREPIQKNVWWSIIVGFIGMSFILKPTTQIFQLGFIYGLFSGITSAVAITTLRVLNTQGEPMSRTLFYFFSVGSIVSFPFAWTVWDWPTPQEWLATLGIGIATAIGQVLLTIAYRYGTASYLSPLSYVCVIYAALIAYIAFDQSWEWLSALGALLIILGGSVSCFFENRSKTLTQSLEHPEHKKTPL